MGSRERFFDGQTRWNIFGDKIVWLEWWIDADGGVRFDLNGGGIDQLAAPDGGFGFFKE